MHTVIILVFNLKSILVELYINQRVLAICFLHSADCINIMIKVIIIVIYISRIIIYNLDTYYDGRSKCNYFISDTSYCNKLYGISL